jgi:hypothetical protein
MRAGDAKQFRAANNRMVLKTMRLAGCGEKQDPFLNLENCLPKRPLGQY